MSWHGTGGAWLIVLIFGGVALWCLLVTPLKRRRFERFAKDAVWATARVVSTDSKTSSDFGDPGAQEVRTYYGDLEFSTEDGRLFQVRREVRKELQTGAEVQVAYHPSDPYEARLDWTDNVWAGSNWPGVLGFVVFAAVGIGFLMGIGAIELD
jgi:hypothetical protein